MGNLNTRNGRFLDNRIDYLESNISLHVNKFLTQIILNFHGFASYMSFSCLSLLIVENCYHFHAGACISLSMFTTLE